MTSPADPVELARRLIKLDTCNPPGGEEPAARLCGEILSRSNWRVSYAEMDPGRTSVIARLGGGSSRAPLVWCGHLDTVPLGHTPWKIDPLAAKVEGKRLLGRGSSDMKSGIAALVCAAAALAPGRDEIWLVLTAAEETGSQGAAFLREEGLLPQKAEALVVAEPTGNRMVLGHKGALGLRVTFHGKAAHGSMPREGKNAIYPAARAVLWLEKVLEPFPAHPLLGRPTVNVGVIQGGTKINMVPDACALEVDIRVTPPLLNPDLLARVQEGLGPQAGVAVLVDMPPILTSSEDPFVDLVKDAAAPVLGEAPKASYASYFTDASVMTPAMGHCPTILLGPGESGQAHRTDEFCFVASIFLATEIYGNIARAWRVGANP